MLRAEIPPPAAPAGLLSPCERELEALLSLFDEAPNPRSRGAALLGSGEDRLCDVADVGDEVAHLYATDPAVRDVIDAVAGPTQPPAEALANARRLLASRDVSPKLRALVSRE